MSIDNILPEPFVSKLHCFEIEIEYCQCEVLWELPCTEIFRCPGRHIGLEIEGEPQGWMGLEVDLGWPGEMQFIYGLS